MGVAFLLCLIAALIPPKRVAVVQNCGQPAATELARRRLRGDLVGSEPEHEQHVVAVRAVRRAATLRSAAGSTAMPRPARSSMSMSSPSPTATVCASGTPNFVGERGAAPRPCPAPSSTGAAQRAGEPPVDDLELVRGDEVEVELGDECAADTATPPLTAPTW